MNRLAPLLVIALASKSLAAQPIPLDGEWRFALDPKDLGIRQTPDNWNFPDKIQLPGKLTEQGFGNVPSFETRWTGGSWRHGASHEASRRHKRSSASAHGRARWA